MGCVREIANRRLHCMHETLRTLGLPPGTSPVQIYPPCSLFGPGRKRKVGPRILGWSALSGLASYLLFLVVFGSRCFRSCALLVLYFFFDVFSGHVVLDRPRCAIPQLRRRTRGRSIREMATCTAPPLDESARRSAAARPSAAWSLRRLGPDDLQICMGRTLAAPAHV